MKSTKTSWLVLVLLLLLWGLNHLAGVFDLYYRFDWYDTMMHTLGGVVAGCIALIGYDTFFNHLRLNRFGMMLYMIAIGFMIGIGWEVFEYIQDVVLGTQLIPTFRDTISDLISDMLGAGLCWYWYIIRG
jgi:hypothetical protein